MKKLRFLSIIMTLALIFSSINCFADNNTESEVIYKGDIDLDGNINAGDALLALKHAAKITEVNTLIADVDEDTAVNATDALLILKYAAKLITEFPGGNTIENTTPLPTETTSPVPSETTSPVPSETTSPTPSETTSPIPSETTSPVPSETTSPTPSETTSPTPTEAATPTPTATPEPTATPTPIQQVKTHITENGVTEEDGSLTIGYSYEEETVVSSINYNPNTDKLIFNLKYYDETDEKETMSVEISMDYDGAFDDADLTVTYSNPDFNQIYQAKTPLTPESITTGVTYAFEETYSENCSTDEKSAILSMADMYMETALSLWNDMLKTELNIGLSDIGFTNYTE